MPEELDATAQIPAEDVPVTEEESPALSELVTDIEADGVDENQQIAWEDSDETEDDSDLDDAELEDLNQRAPEDSEEDEEEDREDRDSVQDEDETSAPTSVTLRDTTSGRDTYAAGGDQYIFKGHEEERGAFDSVGGEDLARLEELFVPSPSCAEYLGRREHGEPLVIVIGPDGCGKSATARYLASHFRDDGDRPLQLVRYRPPTAAPTPSLLDLAASDDAPTASVYIFEDAFDHGACEGELEDLSRCESALHTKRSRLILTSELDRRDLPVGDEYVVSANVQDRQLEDVFRKALGYREWGLFKIPGTIRTQIEDAWDQLRKILNTPAKIHRFCRRLGENPPGDQDEIEPLAREAADPGPRAMREWFHSLKPNGQLLAFLVIFFENLPKPELMELYVAAVRLLRDDGVERLYDPRDLGFGDMLLLLQTGQSGGTIEIRESHCGEEILRQAENHHLLLRSLAELLLRRFRDLRGNEHWQLRKGLGHLVGRLGVLDQTWLWHLLGRLAQDDDWPPNTVAGYALETVIRGDLERRSSVAFRILNSWARADGQRQRWTAGFALWRIYQSLCRDLPAVHHQQAEVFRKNALQLLRTLATEPWGPDTTRLAWRTVKREQNTGDRQALRTATWKRLEGWRQANVVHALERMLRARPREVSEHLVGWMESDRRLRDFALWAAFESLNPPSSNHLEAIPSLLEGLLATSSATRKLSRLIFKALSSWLVRDDLRLGLLRILLDIANRGGTLRRARLRQALAQFWNRTPRQRELAARVIARAHAMDGRLVSRPCRGCGLLVVDPAAHGDERHGKIERHLAALMASRFDLRRGALGRAQIWSPDDPPEDRVQRRRPRFLLPLLERDDGWVAGVVVVLVAAPIPDLGDVVGLSVRRDLFLVDLGGGLPRPDEVEGWELRGQLSEDDFRQLEDGLDAHWTRGLAMSSDADWEPALASLGIDPASPAENRETTLASWADRIDEPDQASGRTDLVHRLCGAFAAWSAKDLPSCLATLARWLPAGETSSDETEDGADRRSLVAAATARTILRLHAEIALGADNREHALVFDELACSLAQHDADGPRAVLRAVSHWLRDPGWREHLLGDVRDGRGRLLRWAEAFLPDRLDELRDALPAEELLSESADTRGLRDRLLSLAGGPRYESLPTLAEGQRHGLILVDGAGPSDLGDTALAVAQRWLKSDSGTVPTIFHLGRVNPVWIPGSSWRPKALPAAPPRLLGPLLEHRGLRPEEVAFLLVLAAGPIVDAADWRDSPWWSRTVVYRPKTPAEPLLFRWVTAPRSVAKDHEAAAEFLFQDLVKELGRREGT